MVWNTKKKKKRKETAEQAAERTARHTELEDALRATRENQEELIQESARVRSFLGNYERSLDVMTSELSETKRSSADLSKSKHGWSVVGGSAILLATTIGGALSAGSSSALLIAFFAAVASTGGAMVAIGTVESSARRDLFDRHVTTLEQSTDAAREVKVQALSTMERLEKKISGTDRRMRELEKEIRDLA